jgi:hypothetical protein
MSAPQSTESHDTYVPLSLLVSVRLPGDATVSDAGGAVVTAEPKGSLLSWALRLPDGPVAGGAKALSFTYAATHPRVPAVEIRADSLPLPAALFTAPGGGAWRAYLGGIADRTAFGLLAQEGAASLHRIGDLTPPVGRPGPGPEKVKYDLVLDSGSATVTPPRPPPPAHGQLWAIALVIALGLFALLNAAWAWARH